ncbi:uncharacterized protein At2g29880-like [Magnolia sinica]|uniref:uncharacterized protein At2g29880-like n=1 Tax=Magnolia sinica TaxID=86752 RepID=UPI002659E2AF|nr:uncharacterized protein At2g29880-like [Magnolia sinica]
MSRNAKASRSGRKAQINWTSYMDECIANALVEEVSLRKKYDNAFREASMNKVAKIVMETFSVQVDGEKCRNRLRTLKKKYNLAKLAHSKSGFGWDEERNCVTAEPDVWDEFIKAKPEAIHIRNKSFPLLAQFDIICGDDSTTGNAARTTSDLEEEVLHSSHYMDDIPLSSYPSGSYTPFAPPDDVYSDGTQGQYQYGEGSGQRDVRNSAPRPLKKKKNASIASNVIEKFERMQETMDEYVSFKTKTAGRLWDELENMTTIDSDMMYRAYTFLAERLHFASTFLDHVSPIQRNEWLERMIP